MLPSIPWASFTHALVFSLFFPFINTSSISTLPLTICFHRFPHTYFV
jgi:hypothetical protein